MSYLLYRSFVIKRTALFTIVFGILSLANLSFAQMSASSSPKETYQQRIFGRSLKSRPLTAHTFGDGAKRVLMIGGMHGDERSATDLARLLVYSYKSKTAHGALTLMITPEVNPDGVAANTRYNARGVDINRNFPSRSWRPEYVEPRYNPGLHPASEPETLALIKLIEEFSPHLIISFHAPLNCVNWDGPAAKYAGRFSELNGYSLCSSLGYETPGSLGQFAGVDKQIPVITLELQQARVTPETMNAILPVRQLLDLYALGNFEENAPNK